MMRVKQVRLPRIEEIEYLQMPAAPILQPAFALTSGMTKAGVHTAK